MPIKLDAHQHFWHYTPADYGWIGPDMQVLQKDHLPPNLALLTKGVGIEGTVAVQARQSLAETEWLLNLAERYTLIRGVVGWVDLCSPDLRGQLERFSAHPKLVGVRHVVQDEPDDQFMLRDDFLRGIGLLADFNLTYDILIFPRHLPVACELVKKFPNQPFVLDHIAKPLIKTGQIAPWNADLRRLAAFANVYCKVSGMVTEANWSTWQPADFRPYLDVCTVAGSYEQVVKLVADYSQPLSPAEQAQIWGETARKFYGLE
jgi:L-fuconolactonase